MRRKNWSPVTLSFLLEMGARAVLWLNPGEEAGTHPIKFGAYAYSAADGGGGSAVYFYLKSDEQHRLDTTDVDLQGAGVEAPVEVARQTKDRKDASAAAHAAAAHNWSMLHDAVAMGNASLVDSLISNELLLPEEMVEFQLSRRSTGVHSRGSALMALADVNRVDVPPANSSHTPLMMAAMYGHSEVVRTLLLRGASPTIRAACGSTAIDLALREDELSVEQLQCKLNAAIALVPALFRHAAGEALCYVAEIAKRARIEQGQRRGSSPADAAVLKDTAERAELVGIELIKRLSTLQRLHLFEREGWCEDHTPEGRPRGFVARAVNVQCKTLLSDSTVQAAMHRRWMGASESSCIARFQVNYLCAHGLRVGALPHSVFSGYVITPNGVEQKIQRPLMRVIILALSAALSVFALPWVALFPSLRGRLLQTLDLSFMLASTDRTPYSEGFRRKWSPSMQLYTRSLYLLDVPTFQFALSSLSTLLLALVLTLVPTPSLGAAMGEACSNAWTQLSRGPEGVWPALTMLADEVVDAGRSMVVLAALLLWIFAHLIDEISSYTLSDQIKLGELLAVSLAFASKLTGSGFESELLAFGLLFMWIAWFLRVFTFLGMGPLVVMLEKMLRDTAQFLFFMVGCATAFAAALHQLFRGADLAGAEDCDPFVDLAQGPAMALKRLLLIAIDPAESIDCTGEIADALNDETEPGIYDFRFAALFIMSVYVVLSVVLLLNMLIAIMAKTFDNVWEIAEIEDRYLRAQLAVQYFGTEPPPPFNLLRLPSHLPELLARGGEALARAPALAARCIRDAVSWLAWLAGLPCVLCSILRELSRQATDQAQASVWRDESGRLSLQDGEASVHRDLDPSDVRYVDGLGQLWSEQYTVEKLQKLEKETRVVDPIDELQRITRDGNEVAQQLGTVTMQLQERLEQFR